MRGERAVLGLLTVIAVLALSSAALAVPLEAVFIENGSIINAENLTLEESKEKDLIYRCFLPPSVLSSLAGTSIQITSGGLVGSTSNTNAQILEPTGVQQESTSGAIDAQGSGQTSTGPGGYAGEVGDTIGGDSTSEGTTVGGGSLPTDPLVMGQLRDKNGKPWGGVRIEISWHDGTKRRTYETITLTRDEALALGDASLEGYYFISRSLVGSATLNIKVLDTEEQQVEEEEVEQRTSPPPKKPESTPERIIAEDRGIDSETAEMIKESGSAIVDFAKKYWWVPFFLAVATLVVLFIRWQGRNILRRLRGVPRAGLVKNARKLFKRQTKHYMLTSFSQVRPETPVRELLSTLFQEDHDYCIVAEKGVVHGVVTTDDLLRNMDAPEGTTAQQMMRRPTVVSATTTFGLSIEQAQQARVLPVTKAGRLVGVLDRKRILEVLDELLSLNISRARKTPLVQELLDDGLRVQSSMKIAKVIEEMRSKNVSTTMVVTDDVLIGSLDDRTLLEELYNYSGTTETMDVDRLMNRKPASVETGVTIFEANKIMLEQRVRAIAVIDRGRVVGALTQRTILKALNRYLTSVQ